jgi:signal peptidase I
VLRAVAALTRWGLLASVVGLAFLGMVAAASGYKPMAVSSGSMRPAYEVGDAIIVKGSGARGVQRGDIIVFRRHPSLSAGSGLVVHRVVREHHIDGNRFFRTKGDANAEPDHDLVGAAAVVGKVEYHLPRVGRQLYWMARWGIKGILGLLLLVISVEEARIIARNRRRARLRRRLLAARTAALAAHAAGAAIAGVPAGVNDPAGDAEGPTGSAAEPEPAAESAPPAEPEPAGSAQDDFRYR